MNHSLKIRIGKAPPPGGVVQCKTVTLRERLLGRLFGAPRRIMVIVPGNSVKELDIREVAEAQGGNGACGEACAPHAGQSNALPASN